GGTVCHGIHALLKAIELALSADLQNASPTYLSVTFSNPVRSQHVVTLAVQRDKTGKVRIDAECEGRSAFAATVELGAKDTNNTSTLLDASFDSARPNDVAFPPTISAGETTLQLQRAQLQKLFPGLASHNCEHWIADLLATTRIVGMRCPGLNSIFCNAKLRRRTSATGDAMRFTVEHVDKRFQLIRLGVRGGYFEGSIEGFFRPQAVAQRSLAEIAATIPSDSFHGHHALVVGGSRGLGELAAKIVLAGDGSVVISYATGREDAERICEEARQLNRRCTSEQLLAEQLVTQPPEWLRQQRFSHAYFFASPHIAKGAAKQWNHELFERFASVYVDAFAKLVAALTTHRAESTPLKIFYPSSVFVDDCPEGFAEYAAAKSAGETLCAYISRQLNIVIAHPRLPRMKTDQTTGQTDTGAVDPFPIVLSAIQALHAK
ncbi:MAG TPA: SDR family oxidoreductase, partial [Steroidobacteraceae bacterium]|nr:SDR family oxidoreductase [Steroidobacteraceae bacterium]